MNDELTVVELIARLQTFPQDIPVFTSDSEGNWYDTLCDWEVNLCGYAKDREGDIEVGILELTKESKLNGFTEEDVYPNPCVVIG